LEFGAHAADEGSDVLGGVGVVEGEDGAALALLADAEQEDRRVLPPGLLQPLVDLAEACEFELVLVGERRWVALVRGEELRQEGPVGLVPGEGGDAVAVADEVRVVLDQPLLFVGGESVPRW
jgi:hypothetical protein